MERIKVVKFLLLLLPLLLASCSLTGRVTEEPGVETGVASWYGSDFHGRPTASGEVYNMYAMTAAHKTLPLGTIVRVTNLENGRSARVTINDRGPFVRGRIIDLSYAAAKKLDMVVDGTARVRIEPLGRDKKYVKYIKIDDSGTGDSYTVQLGSFTLRENAVRLRDAVAIDHDGVFITEAVVRGKKFFRVRLGDFPERDAAIDAARSLAYEGFEVVVMRR